MLDRLARLVTRRWWLVLAFWLVLVLGVRLVAPRWDDVTHDGDFAYLPKEMTSVQGEKLLESAFPQVLSKSQVAVVVARPDGPLEPADFEVADRLVQQFTPGDTDEGPVTGVWSYESQVVGKKLISRADAQGQAVLIVLHLRNEFMAVDNIGLLDSIYRAIDVVQLEEGVQRALERQQAARSDLGEILVKKESDQRLALARQVAAWQLDLRDKLVPLVPWFRGTSRQEAQPFERVLDKACLVLDVLARDDLAEAIRQSDTLADAATVEAPDDPVKRLEAVQSRAVDTLGLVHQATEGALEAIRKASITPGAQPAALAEDVAGRLDDLERQLDAELAGQEEQARRPAETLAAASTGAAPGGLRIGVTGSAAIGSDMLSAAKESIRNTELTTILMVVVILLIVYRAPGLVLVPVVTILASTAVAMGLIALGTQLSEHIAWLDFKVFKTTKIFIVVIVFGGGTDYCLFLIARYKEELARGLEPGAAVARSLSKVGDALAASALTTIVGLATMIFADFGKFRNSGPVIAFCLTVALLACITLAPALLRAMGRSVFWPLGVAKRRPQGQPEERERYRLQGDSAFGWFWERVAGALVARPGLILVASLLLLAPLAASGIFGRRPVTYDLLSELPASRPSVEGTRLLEQHFLPGETGPVTVLAYDASGSLDTKEGSRQIALLTRYLYDLAQFDSDGSIRQDAHGEPIDPIISVRSLAEPLGGPPGSFNPLSAAGRNKLAVLKHPRTKATFLAQSPGYAGRVARLDLVLPSDPFARESVRLLDYIESRLRALADGSCLEWPDDQWPEKLSPQQRSELAEGWRDVTFRFVGTTAGIRDLQTVTGSDQRRIEQLVVIAVLAVLIVILRRPVVCVYLVLSVVLGYVVTIGVTEWFFAWCYGPAFDGLDWKVPIFLFVLLVAVGADYNIYLTTRVFEEQRRRGAREGLRAAVVHTGGIITSCGVIMAATFASMITGTLRAMQELGFALALGVLLDTFVIRTIIVPSFLALLPTHEPAETRRTDGGDVSHGPLPHLAKPRPAAETEAAQRSVRG